MKSVKLRRGLTALIAITSLGLISASCTTAPGTGAGTSWEFKATSMTNNDSQDEIRVFGACVAIPNCNDEPYVINVATRVKLGKANSASGFVVSSRGSNPENVPEGESRTLTGAAGAPAVFNNVDRLDLLDLADTNRNLEVLVIYSWIMEEDTVAVNTAANDVKDILIDALNTTLAAGSLPQDLNALLDVILDNIGNALTLLLSNIPLLGLGDDALGGAINVGIAAQGALGDIINGSIAGANTAGISIPVLSLPPDIEHINIFSMGATKTFTGQSFSGAGGTHTYNFSANKVVAA